MKSVLAEVKNVRAFFVAGQALMDAPVGVPRFSVAFGDTGRGKSRTAAAWAAETDAAYVRALATWRSPGPMLESICAELGMTPRAKHTHTVTMIAETLARSARLKPLLVDEADFLVKYPILLDVLRDIHDIAQSPITMIGMKHFLQRLLSLREQEQLVRRITQVVEFKPFDLEDAGTLVNTIADVDIAPDLIERIHKETAGSAGLLVNALQQLEEFAKNKGLKTVTAKDAVKLEFTLDRRPELMDRLGLRSALTIGSAA